MRLWGTVGTLAVAALAGVLLSACNVGPQATERCDNAFKSMETKIDRMSAASATVYTDDEWNAVELGPLTACENWGDWLSGAEDHPEAVGFTNADAVDLEALAIRCHPSAAAATRVCRSLARDGLR